MTHTKIKLLDARDIDALGFGEIPVCLPLRKTGGAAGFDLASNEDQQIAPGHVAMVPCGFAMELPPGHEAQVRPRSSLSAAGIVVMFGTIDEDYRGEVKVVLMNLSGAVFHVKRGDRVGQMVIAARTPMDIVVIDPNDELSETKRGAAGFGSTGK